MARHGQKQQEAPIILAVDLASMCGSIALVAKNITIAEYSLHSSQTHSKRLIPQIERIIQESGIIWDEIEAIAVSLGPGSFTGLRIALSTVKGLAMAFNKKLIGIATLDGLAAQIQHHPLTICPIMDARKKEVYTALYRCSSAEPATRISKYMVISPDNLTKHITEKTLFIGDAVAIYQDFLQEKLADLAFFGEPIINFTRASAIGLLAQVKFQQNEFLDPATITPLYVRASDAELNFNSKKG